MMIMMMMMPKVNISKVNLTAKVNNAKVNFWGGPLKLEPLLLFHYSQAWS